MKTKDTITWFNKELTIYNPIASPAIFRQVTHAQNMRTLLKFYCGYLDEATEKDIGRCKDKLESAYKELGFELGYSVIETISIKEHLKNLDNVTVKC